MGRWEPDSVGRLRGAALELFVERGYEQTTVADIARLAGVTERTFFRYFTDKREVLFVNSGDLLATVTAQIAAAPDDLPALEVMGRAMEAAGASLGTLRGYAQLRQKAIADNPDLQERELLKLASLAAAAAQSLHDRGVTEPTASLAAETGVTVFKLGFERWVSDRGEGMELAECIRQTLDDLRALTAVT